MTTDVEITKQYHYQSTQWFVLSYLEIFLSGHGPTTCCILMYVVVTGLGGAGHKGWYAEYDHFYMTSVGTSFL